MNSENNSIYDLFSPEFWDENLNSQFDDLQQGWFDFWRDIWCDLEMCFKLWILLFCPSLAPKIWPLKEKL